eukprot:6617986-Pyramimonas_sp.AAC.1
MARVATTSALVSDSGNRSHLNDRPFPTVSARSEEEAASASDDYNDGLAEDAQRAPSPFQRAQRSSAAAAPRRM